MTATVSDKPEGRNPKEDFYSGRPDISYPGQERGSSPMASKKIGSKPAVKPKTNTFSRTTALEKTVANLEKTVREQAEIISGLLTKSGSSLSIEDTSEEKRLRALKEQGAIKYGD